MPRLRRIEIVPFRCKSRFCPSCGNKYNQMRSFHISCKLVNCIHRHCVFTIPKELRPFLRIVLSLAAFFTLFAMLSYACFLT
uniref:transposase zinc-binding domain-containing protein n=1 Tax=Ruminococcus gauvreauii TaxID=438033 RepID=UPI0009FCB0A4